MTPDSLRTGKLGNMFTGGSQFVAICPVNNTRITSDQWQQATVIGDEALWWKCPECEDWHLIVIDRQGDEKKEH